MEDNPKTVLGATESVKIRSINKSIRARIDTGAATCSIHHDIVEKYKLGPVVGKKKIRNAHGQAFRPVIKLPIKIAGRLLDVKFTVADRSEMKFNMLIGRNVLKKKFVVDVAKK